MHSVQCGATWMLLRRLPWCWFIFQPAAPSAARALQGQQAGPPQARFEPQAAACQVLRLSRTKAAVSKRGLGLLHGPPGVPAPLASVLQRRLAAQ